MSGIQPVTHRSGGRPGGSPFRQPHQLRADPAVTIRYVCPLCGLDHSRVDHAAAIKAQPTQR